MKKFTIPIFVIFIFFKHGVTAQWLSTSGQKIINDKGEEILLRGMGLGGWMLMEGYMMHTAAFANPQHLLKEKIIELIGEEETETFFNAWLTNHVSEADIDSLKLWGFNSVRLPMHYNLFTLPIEEEPTEGENTWLDKGFQLTDQLLEWCKKNELYLILDLHAAPGGQGMDQAISDYDPSKPALWESNLNREKTVALWGRIAERYKNEPWIGGFDLLNEPNWEMPGNVLLKRLYEQITEAIRAIDKRHIIFIEGNWFANDFTNLTPPWDDNMVYSPHKYWSFNDQASIQWVLDIREEHNVPLYFGESGENSNVWFRDAIKLFEDNQIGWAWWPLKKIESIAGPLSITKTKGYQNLLDYWSGNGEKPSAEEAKNTLMDLAAKANISACRYQKEVIDAMFRQVHSDETVSFKVQDVPGIVYATDYDMGVVGTAYHDNDLTNYLVSTGSFSSWNQGWNYRNDGVDIEISEDTVNSNGYNVGWIGSGEWMKYSVTVEETALYDIEMRVASNSGDGQFYFAVGKAAICPITDLINTGGWQNWQTITIPNVVLSKADPSFTFNIVEEGFNLGSFKFIKSGATTEVNTTFVSAITEGENTILVDVNKPIDSAVSFNYEDFVIEVNGEAVQIIQINLFTYRSILFEIDRALTSNDFLQISYNGNTILAEDETSLINFTNEAVKNTIFEVHQIPGVVEAEDYFFQSGIQLENTSDVGGGQNIAYLDVGDYVDYFIEVPTSGNYQVEYRTASESEGGGIQLQIIEPDETITTLHEVTFPATNGWQNWTTTTESAYFDEGQHQLRMVITTPLFNINWLKFDLVNSAISSNKSTIVLYPNPTQNISWLNFDEVNNNHFELFIYATNGQLIYKRKLVVSGNGAFPINLNGYSNGLYHLHLQDKKGTRWMDKLIKMP